MSAVTAIVAFCVCNADLERPRIFSVSGVSDDVEVFAVERFPGDVIFSTTAGQLYMKVGVRKQFEVLDSLADHDLYESVSLVRYFWKLDRSVAAAHARKHLPWLGPKWCTWRRRVSRIAWSDGVATILFASSSPRGPKSVFSLGGTLQVPMPRAVTESISSGEQLQLEGVLNVRWSSREYTHDAEYIGSWKSDVDPKARISVNGFRVKVDGKWYVGDRATFK